MILIDTGPLVALLNHNDPYHQAAVRGAGGLPDEPFVTTWPCFTEAMYFLRRVGGYAGRQALWDRIADGLLTLRNAEPDEVGRMAELMRTYRNLPMDLADASVVAAAEATGTRRVFTFDGHYRIYRLRDGSALEVVPQTLRPRGARLDSVRAAA